jgi:hypothetical protein
LLADCLNAFVEGEPKVLQKTELGAQADSENNLRDYVPHRLDEHKKTISYCVKDVAGRAAPWSMSQPLFALLLRINSHLSFRLSTGRQLIDDG